MSDIVDCAGIIDSHAHYFDKWIEGCADGADKILREDVFGRGIAAVINVGTSSETNGRCIAQARKYENMYCAVGIHPEDAQLNALSLEAEMEKLRSLLEGRAENKIVAIGEIGLDYHVDEPDKRLQSEFFNAQMALASEIGLPVIIHDRDAHGDCFETVLKYPDVKGVFHSYSGSPEMALELIKRGWYISFSGVLTFKNARKALEAAAAAPLDRILIETDAPYLAPVPFRGRMNHSGLLGYTAEALALVKGLTKEEVIRATAENTRRLFGIN